MHTRCLIWRQLYWQEEVEDAEVADPEPGGISEVQRSSRRVDRRGHVDEDAGNRGHILGVRRGGRWVGQVNAGKT